MVTLASAPPQKFPPRSRRLTYVFEQTFQPAEKSCSSMAKAWLGSGAGYHRCHVGDLPAATVNGRITLGRDTDGHDIGAVDEPRFSRLGCDRIVASGCRAGSISHRLDACSSRRRARTIFSAAW